MARIPLSSQIVRIQTIAGFPVNKFGAITNLPLDSPCPKGFTPHARQCYETTALRARFHEYESQKATGFIPTLLTVGPVFAAGIATLLTAGAAAPSLSTALGAARLAASTVLKIGSSIVSASPSISSSLGGSMGFNLGGVLGGLGGLLGGVSAVPVLQDIGQIAQAFAPAFATGPISVAGPVYGPAPQMPQRQGQQTMAGMPVIAAGAGAIARLTAPILFKIASKIGRRVSLQSTITMIRKMGKFLMDPTAIAVALGITVGELATLITAHSSRKVRHMNAANPKALRRAARRIKSFHRMCGTIDLLKSRGKRSRTFVTSSAICNVCRKRPCRC